ncbi:hypothetical protein ACROYT_G014227 [Oculina patagonica]
MKERCPVTIGVPWSEVNEDLFKEIIDYIRELCRFCERNDSKSQPPPTDKLIRVKLNPCKSSVMECTCGVYQIRSNCHSHPGEVRAALTAQITEKAKAHAFANNFKSESAIVEDMPLEDLQDIACPSLLRPEYIARAA